MSNLWKKVYLRFKVGAWSDPASPFYGWTHDVFKIFEMVENKPDIVLVGTGGTIHRFPPFLSTYLNGLGFQTEILSSKQAASTYNVLSEEGRNVALAVLPLIPTSPVTKKILVELKTNRT